MTETPSPETDPASDLPANWGRLRRLAEAEVDATLRSLPKKLRAAAKELPVTYEPRPNAALVADGLDADLLGLFVGPDYAGEMVTSHPLPPQIILFLVNLWEFSEEDEEIFCDEVHTTYLHELGHYLGLDEDDLFARELD